MAHRVVEIPWTPHSRMAWATSTTSRKAAAVLWNAMVVRHARIRRLNWRWPSFARWCRWAKGRCLGLSAQSVQQIVSEFCEAIDATTAARKAQRVAGGEVTAVYPWKTKARYRDVTYTNQCAVRDGEWLRLSHGRGNPPLRIQIPAGVTLPGRIMEVRLAFGVARVVCEVPDEAPMIGPRVVVGVDLGVNTLIAATDGETAVLVSGREAKAIVQYRNKMLASAESRLSKYKKGSRRHKKLQRRKYKHLDKCNRKVRDLCHKATRIVADAFPNATVVVGQAFQGAAQKMGRRQAQQVSTACTGRITAQLDYKLRGARKVSEAYSSQQCPWCECRQKCRRVYRCKVCGLVAPRDVVGAVDIRAIGLYGRLMPRQKMPTVVRFVRPLRKYPVARATGSSGGTPARAAA